MNFRFHLEMSHVGHGPKLNQLYQVSRESDQSYVPATFITFTSRFIQFIQLDVNWDKFSSHFVRT